jgi:tetratricopeptide (TPR) repeat protein
MKTILFALLLLALPVGASAAPMRAEDIFALYARGDYEQAAKLGEAAHTAAGYAIAARAVLADDVLRDAPCMECLLRAESLSRQAIAADPHSALGHVWLAVALGYQSRLLGPIRSRLKDTPNQSKTALYLAWAAEPNNAFAISALGGWHIEVVRAGGAFLARHVYGATEAEGLSLFDQAVKADPGNVAVHYQIALSLAGFNLEKYRARVTAELRASLSGTADTAYEKKIQTRATELLGLLNQGAHDAFDSRVRKYQGFAD